MEAKGHVGVSGQHSKTERSEDFVKEPELGLDEQDQDLTQSLDAVDTRYTAAREVEPRIHILGMGSIGKLVAWALRGLPNPPPVTLCFHRLTLCEAWEKGKQEVVIQDGQYAVSRTGYEIELTPRVTMHHGVIWNPDNDPDPYRDSRRPHEVAQDVQKQRIQQGKTVVGEAEGETVEFLPTTKETVANAGMDALSLNISDINPASPSKQTSRPHWTRFVSEEPIHNLVVTVKAAHTINAIATVRHRLTRDSTICFLQNGMGIVEEVNEKLFPNEAERPTYMQGVLTHGVNVPPETARTNPFFAVHAGRGTIALGVLPRGGYQSLRPRDDTPSNDMAYGQRELADVHYSPTARYLLRTLTRSPVLCAVGHNPIELLQLQLEKVAVNSIVNPLTSLLDCRNGHLNANDGISRTMRLMLAETSHVITSLPELRSIPGVPTRFSSRRLEQICKSIADQTGDNISSMLTDVRAGNRTEIDYINGYIINRGEEVGIKCVVNYAIMQTVKAKQVVVNREIRDEIPFDSGR